MNHIRMSNEIVTLYHGSKSGIQGIIEPKSRDKCDFGKGFYMGTDMRQPLTLINSLSALNLGKQYVALTEKACMHIKIVKEQCISEEEKAKLKYESEKSRSEGIELAETICRKYRREGRFFDEILEAGEWNA